MIKEDVNPKTNEKKYDLVDAAKDKEEEKPELYPILANLQRAKPDEKLNLDKIKDACQGKLTPKEIQEGLEDLAELGVIAEKVNPKTKKKEFKVPKEDDKLPTDD